MSVELRNSFGWRLYNTKEALCLFQGGGVGMPPVHGTIEGTRGSCHFAGRELAEGRRTHTAVVPNWKNQGGLVDGARHAKQGTGTRRVCGW